MRHYIPPIGSWRQFLVVQKHRDIRRAANNHRFHTHEVPTSKPANYDQQQQDQNDYAERASSRLRRRIIAGRGVNRSSNLRSWWQMILIYSGLRDDRGWRRRLG